MNLQNKKIAIIGASGFGREVADVVVELGASNIIFVEKNPNSKEVMGFPVLSEEYKTVMRLSDEGYEFSIAIGNSSVRKQVFEKYTNLKYTNIVHPSVTFGVNQLDNLLIKKGNIIAAGCRFTNSIEFGNFGVFNLNTIIGHDCIVSDFVSLMAGVVVSGNVLLGECSYVGSGAAIIQGKNDKKRKIGQNATVGMGAVVLRNVKSNTTVFGNPAKIIQ